MSSLEFGENFRGRIAFIELFEEIVALQVFFGLFLVGFESGIKDPFNFGRGRGCWGLGYRNRSRRLTHIEGMRGVAGRRNAGVGTRGERLID